MLRADQTVTFVHREPSPHGDTYTCTIVTGSWYEQIKSAVTDALTERGLKTARIVKCRIPCRSPGALAALRRGDKFLKGELTAADSTVFASLGRTYGAVTILDIHDNTDAINGHYYFEGSD